MHGRIVFEEGVAMYRDCPRRLAVQLPLETTWEEGLRWRWRHRALARVQTETQWRAHLVLGALRSEQWDQLRCRQCELQFKFSGHATLAGGSVCDYMVSGRAFGNVQPRHNQTSQLGTRASWSFAQFNETHPAVVADFREVPAF